MDWMSFAINLTSALHIAAHGEDYTRSERFSGQLFNARMADRSVRAAVSARHLSNMDTAPPQ